MIDYLIRAQKELIAIPKVSNEVAVDPIVAHDARRIADRQCSLERVKQRAIFTNFRKLWTRRTSLQPEPNRKEHKNRVARVGPSPSKEVACFNIDFFRYQQVALNP